MQKFECINWKKNLILSRQKSKHSNKKYDYLETLIIYLILNPKIWLLQIEMFKKMTTNENLLAE